mmetsp:Transcript_81760/g.243831  ORF Transcript_81760/g.243831 Transcript_81760/m.243831 type:complete len:229 (-) Transcript_81760:128-814(-)
MPSGFLKPSSPSSSSGSSVEPGNSDATRSPRPPARLPILRALHAKKSWSPTAHAARTSQHARLNSGARTSPPSAAQGAACNRACGSKVPRDGARPAMAVVSRSAESDGTRTRCKDAIPAIPGAHTKTPTRTTETTDRKIAWAVGMMLQSPSCQTSEARPTPRGMVTSVAVKAGWQKAKSTPSNARDTALKPGGGHGRSGARRDTERPQQTVVRTSPKRLQRPVQSTIR